MTTARAVLLSSFPVFRRTLLAAVAAATLAPAALARADEALDIAKLLPGELKAAVHGSVPSAIQSKDTLLVATDGTAGKPYAWVEGDSSIKGVAADMAQAIGYVLGAKVRMVNTPFDGMIPSLQAGRVDFLISDMLDTKKREAVVDFVDYLVDGSSILIGADSKLSDLTLDKMCGLTVGSIRGSVEQGYLEKQAAQCKADGKPALTTNIYQGNDQMMLALVSGRVDAMMGASAQLAYLAEVSHGKSKQGGPPVGVAVDGVGTLKGNGLAAPIQQALQKLMDSGVYGKILAFYGMQSNAVPQATLNDAKF
jgi:polar amino acid transport system substrate-binding protein